MPLLGQHDSVYFYNIAYSVVSCKTSRPKSKRKSHSPKLKQTNTSKRKKRRIEQVTKAIPHEIGGVHADALRFGFHGVKSDILDSHPLQTAYPAVKKSEEDMKRTVLANTYGSAFPLKLDLDRQILSRFQRPPGPIPSSMLGLEAYTGDSETLRAPDMHHVMEVRLGLSKGPVCPSFF